MNYDEVKKILKDAGVTDAMANDYAAYIRTLISEKSKGVLKNPWAAKIPAEVYCRFYLSVLGEGLILDGKTVTLQYKGKLMVSYGYQAYKNKVLHSYPESVIDLQLVHKGDEFHLRKESGEVKYKHVIVDPFATARNIIGAYCVIKNKRGEFVETLNADDIHKIRSTAKTQSVWKAWEGEMVKKSVIKRACKLHFYDVVEKIDEADNEATEPERVSVDYEMQEKIENCKSAEELTTLYELNKEDVEDQPEFLRLLSDRRRELESEKHPA